MDIQAQIEERLLEKEKLIKYQTKLDQKVEEVVKQVKILRGLNGKEQFCNNVTRAKVFKREIFVIDDSYAPRDRPSTRVEVCFLRAIEGRKINCNHDMKRIQDLLNESLKSVTVVDERVCIHKATIAFKKRILEAFGKDVKTFQTDLEIYSYELPFIGIEMVLYRHGEE